MGGVLSTVKILVAFCWSLRTSLVPVIQRIHADPGRPSQNPTKPFWLSRPHPNVAKHQSEPLPEEADVVIIGSGITGTAIAKTLLEPQSGTGNHAPLRVAMLDARDACSGATGRNGGHIKESAYLEYKSLKEKHGKEAAIEVTRFRLAHLDALLAVAEAEGEEVIKDSQIRKCETADVCFEEEVWESTKGKLEVFLEDFEDQRGLWAVHEMGEARKLYPFPTAHGAVSSVAGCLWPYRLFAPILSRLLTAHPTFTLDTSTPAIAIIAPTPASPDHYTIYTTRGVIRTRHIVHATNAHAAHLLPGLRGLLFPVRGHMTAQRLTNPRSPLDDKGCSYSILWSEGLDYITQLLPDSPDSMENMVMLGGGLFRAGDNGFGEIGETSDEGLSLMASAHLGGVLGATTGRLGCVAVQQIWTGCLGFTPDGMAWVGKVPKRLAAGRKRPAPRRANDIEENKNANPVLLQEGKEWVAAGFNGEGMVNAWLSGVALARMILGEKEDEVGLPKLMLITEGRVKSADLLESAQRWLT